MTYLYKKGTYQEGEVRLRIKDHPILSFEKKKPVMFHFNETSMSGWQGDSIAAALHAAGVKVFSESLRYGRPRGFFCGIGKCSSCLMEVNGIPNVRTCIAPLIEGIRVNQQDRLAAWPTKDHSYDISQESHRIIVDILVVGAGPAGLEAAIQAATFGASVLLVDENPQVGGQLVKQTHKFFGSKQERAGIRGIMIAEDLLAKIESDPLNKKISLMLESTVFGSYEGQSADLLTFGVSQRKEYASQLHEVGCKAVIFAVGAMENMLLFPGNDLPGVYGAGAVQTLMNVYGVKPGKRVLMVGAGNVGLIVSYQLLQAGIQVDRVVEAAPRIGGYHVHAAKLRRCGVPILTRHSIQEVRGTNSVDEVVTVGLDDSWQPISGTEEIISCDTVCLAVGLTPSTRLHAQMAVQMETIPEAGGFVALHNERMQTSNPYVFVAGDSSGIEEASTAMIEGKIAGVAAAITIGYESKEAKNKLEEFQGELHRLRAGPFGEKPRIAKEKIASIWGKHYETL